MKFCDECLTAAYDEGASADIIEEILSTMGADIPDHCCGSIETGTRCDCACH